MAICTLTALDRSRGGHGQPANRAALSAVVREPLAEVAAIRPTAMSDRDWDICMDVASGLSYRQTGRLHSIDHSRVYRIAQDWRSVVDRLTGVRSRILAGLAHADAYALGREIQQGVARGDCKVESVRDAALAAQALSVVARVARDCEPPPKPTSDADDTQPRPVTPLDVGRGETPAPADDAPTPTE